MAKNENEKTDQEKEAERVAAVNAARQRTQLPSSDSPSESADKTTNLTRQSVETTLKSRYMAEGKSTQDAALLAKKRALEMVPTAREEFRQADEARLIAAGTPSEDAAKQSEKAAREKFD